LAEWLWSFHGGYSFVVTGQGLEQPSGGEEPVPPDMKIVKPSNDGTGAAINT
jgi:hypothetical protein